MSFLSQLNLGHALKAIFTIHSGAQDSVAQFALTTLVETYVPQGADILGRALTLPADECARLAHDLGITSEAGIAHFTQAVQAVGTAVGNIATATLEAKTL